jgi:hypothetical protein
MLEMHARCCARTNEMVITWRNPAAAHFCGDGECPLPSPVERLVYTTQVVRYRSRLDPVPRVIKTPNKKRLQVASQCQQAGFLVNNAN